MARDRIHSQRVRSESDPYKEYQVYLFKDGATCECADFFNRNVVAGNSKHECKHIKEVRAGFNPLPAFLHSVALSGRSQRRIDVYEDLSGGLFLRALTVDGLHEQPALMSEAEIQMALTAGRQVQREGRYPRWIR